MDQETLPSKKKKRSLLLVFFSLLFLSGLLYIVSTVNPTHSFPYPVLASIPVIFLFFTLLFFSCFCFFTFLLNHTRRGLLIALCICSYLLLRLNGISDPMFGLILLMVFVTGEIFFSKIVH